MDALRAAKRPLTSDELLGHIMDTRIANRAGGRGKTKTVPNLSKTQIAMVCSGMREVTKDPVLSHPQHGVVWRLGSGLYRDERSSEEHEDSEE